MEYETSDMFLFTYFSSPFTEFAEWKPFVGKTFWAQETEVKLATDNAYLSVKPRNFKMQLEISFNPIKDYYYC